MKVTATGSRETRTGYDTKRSGAAKVHALVAPLSGNGSDGVFILFSCPGIFLLNGLQGKLPDEGGDVGRPPYRSAQPQLYRFGKTAFLAALPPCAFADGNTFKNLRQMQKGIIRQFFHRVSPYVLFKVNLLDGLWLSSRQDSRPIPEAYGGVPAGILRGCKFRVSAPWGHGQAGVQSSHGYSRVR